MRILPFAALTVSLGATTAIAQTDLAPSADAVTGSVLVTWTASVERKSGKAVNKLARAYTGAKRCQARKRHCAATGRRRRVKLDGASTPYNLPPNLGFGIGTGL